MVSFPHPCHRATQYGAWRVVSGPGFLLPVKVGARKRDGAKEACLSSRVFSPELQDGGCRCGAVRGRETDCQGVG